MAVDLTYPLLPIFCVIDAALMLLVLMTHFIRQSWNLGVSFLCFWLFWDLLTCGIDAVVWADNADLKMVLDNVVEWTVGFGVPALVTGVFYYIVQGLRFQIEEGFGCSDTVNTSGLSFLLIYSWPIILPSISLLFYCPKIIFVFYRYSRATNDFLQSNDSVSRPNYIRLLALASVDIVLTLPFGIVSVVEEVNDLFPGFPLQFYEGWTFTHSDWAPASYPYVAYESKGGWVLANYYLSRWSSVTLALVIFLLFGLTGDARATYRRGFYTVSKLFGLKLAGSRQCENLGDIAFDRPQVDTMFMNQYFLFR
ncbi:pheromone A receptor-domain-containing protein [Vararia minispora EC-137]|uniref:Pheromone A receptor-domain-containing protein n=1 Tax=Vararia minispora EC-137 TaxID=1314806 RepID=A0ACB8QYG5_9AGAM|nr:pheromone A receptor-domain-containing protein [Vararia minispora EC-137]